MLTFDVMATDIIGELAFGRDFQGFESGMSPFPQRSSLSGFVLTMDPICS